LTDYSFDRAHVDPILSGEKTFTLRPTGKITHAKVGERIRLLAEGETEPFAEAVCVFRAHVLLTDRGVTLQKTAEDGDAGYAMWRLFQAASSGSLAAGEPGSLTPLQRIASQDGFASWADLYAWHALKTNTALGRQVWRELIGWSALLASAPALAEAV
jgi:hypothetical protein